MKNQKDIHHLDAPTAISGLAFSKSTLIGRNRNGAPGPCKRKKIELFRAASFPHRLVRRNSPCPPHNMSKKLPG
jgi:hypothetical protein